ncbi:hypothetical protein WJX73_005666 [Symbiochloris irregularis]|uniref:Epoxide hydrolase N-terminal domain-containing protein n=1 Tax=Symbiochloris irregularis TaxID=706552 RepID=A0AAW1PUP6_9CHLO
MGTFEINVSSEDQSDLRERISRTRLPDQQEGVGWDQGTPSAYLEELIEYWRSSYSWPKQQEWLNTHFKHFRQHLNRQQLHYVHHASPDADAIPLLLVHGWPSSFLDFHKLIPRLEHGSRRRRYHIVAPSLPGYGFSAKPAQPGFGVIQIASTLNDLMVALGYRHYVVYGGDWGTLIAFVLGTRHPQNCRVIYTLARAVPRLHRPWHVAQLLNHRLPWLNKMPITMTHSELKGLDDYRHLEKHEFGYRHIQGTKPQTLGCALNYSPAGLAAWIVEKYKTWSDCHGNIESRFTKDELLTQICIYWFTGTITSSMRLYYESGQQWASLMQGYCKVPTAIAKFPADHFSSLPRAWIEQAWNVKHFKEFDSGGHFPALEEPDLLAEDIDRFFDQIESLDPKWQRF